MPAPPDNFQRRTFVRLPFADEYLSEGGEGRIAEELKEAFRNPIITVKISGDSTGRRSGKAEAMRPSARE